MWLLYILLISFLGVLVVLFAKIRELKAGRQNLVGKVLAKGDPLVLAIGARVQAFLNHHGERTFFLFLVHIPSRVETFFKNLRARAHNHYHGVKTKMRDQRDLSENRVSPYMRSMSFRRNGDGSRF